jgi:hypothetical protein
MQVGKDKDQKIKDLYEKLQGEMFKPDFNANSKWILQKKKKEELIKKENGKSKNVDYYEAFPRCALDNETMQNRYLSSKSPRKSTRRLRKSKSKAFTSPKKSARSKSNATATKKEKWEAETLRVIKESQKKNTEIIPSYVSPYNKTMLGSGLPLKTIINKTNANMKKFKKSKNRGKSRSHSKLNTKLVEEDDLDNTTMLGIMRKAFHNEIPNAKYYKKVPIRKNMKPRF